MRDNTINLEFGFDIHSQEAIDSRFLMSAYDMSQVGLHDDDPTSKYHTARFPEHYFALLDDSEGQQLYVYDKNRVVDSEGDESFIGKFARVDYNYIKKHPSINNVELANNKFGEELHLQNKLIEGEGVDLVAVPDSEGFNEYLIRASIDGQSIVFNADGKMLVPFDNRTIVIDAAGKVAVPIDNLTIQIDSEGRMVAMPEPLLDGVATEVRYVGRDETVNVLVDDATIEVNGDNKLEVIHDDSIVVDSEGLHVNIDNRTLYQDSEGKIKAQLHNAYDSIHEVTGLRSDLQGYVYDTLYTSYDYADLDRYQLPVFPFNCTAVKNGNFYGRNLDWTYDENAEFIVRTPRIGSRYAAIGIASCINISKDFVRSGAYSDKYKLLPLMMCDGINEKGVVANTNVVPNDRGTTTASVPAGTVEMKIVSIGLIRFMLDNFATAREAAEYVRDHVEVRTTRTIAAQGFEQHFMVADANEAFVIEFLKGADGKVHNVIKEQNCMTNFYENDVTFDANGKAYTPYTHSVGGPAATTQGIETHGCGLERWNLIKDNYASANTKAGMRALMKELFYTKSYTLDNLGAPETFWFTEYTKDALTVDSLPGEFASQVAADKAKFAVRSRVEGDPNFGTWQTTHSTVFDIANKSMSVVFQEDDSRVFEFEFDYYTKEKVDELLKENTSIDDITIKRNADSELFVNIDDLTIKVNSEGKLAAIPEPLVEGRATDAVYDGRNEKVNVRTDDYTVKVNAGNKLFIPIDNKTIFVDSEDGLIKADPEALIDGTATHAHYTSEGYERVDVLVDDATIKVNGANKVEVQIDNQTIKLVDGKLRATPEALVDGTATHVYYTSEGNERVDVKFDNDTIKLNSEGKLYSLVEAVVPGEAIRINADHSIDVKYDSESIVLNSEGELAVPIDGKTIIFDSEGKLATQIGGWRKITAGTQFNYTGGVVGTDHKTHSPWSGIYIPEAGKTIVCNVRVTHGGTPLTEAATFTMQDLGDGYITGRNPMNALLDEIKFKKTRDFIDFTFDSTTTAVGDDFTVESIGVHAVYHKINYKYIPIDDKTIIINDKGELKAVAEALGAGKAISVDSENNINVLYDDASIKLNSEGKLFAVAEPLKDGIATTVRYLSTGEETVDVLFDNDSIVLNSEGKLITNANRLTLPVTTVSDIWHSLI